MRFAVTAALASAVSVAQARIYGIAVPATIKPGDGFNAIIESSDYIQTVYDVAVAFGASSGEGFPDSLGTVIGSYYLGPEQSNQLNNFTKWVTTPATLPKGPGYISASFMSLYGAAAEPVLVNYNVSVTFGDATSTNYAASSP